MLHKHIHRTYVPERIYFVTTDVRYHRPFFTDEHLARIVEHSIWHERTAKFIIYAYVVMPDHLHVLLQPMRGDISEIMRSIKTNSSRGINVFLTHSRGRATSAMVERDGNAMPERTGNFRWQQSFYDHVIRDERDLRNHVEYIRYNPVKAGLVQTPEDYPFLYVDWNAIRRVLVGE